MTGHLGPQTREIEQVLGHLPGLTLHEAMSLRGMFESHDEERWMMAWEAAEDPLASYSVLAEAEAIAVMHESYGPFADLHTLRQPILDVVRALSVRDLIGQGSFKQADYDLLTSPWRYGVGPAHPEDAIFLTCIAVKNP